MGLSKKLKYVAASSLAVFSLAGVTIGTVAWFQTAATINYEYDIGGESLAAYFAYGDGSAEHPYGIRNTRHLNNLAWLQYNGNFNDAGKHYHFELADNINATGYCIPPIGTEDNPFVGVFDGQGYTITGLKVSNDSSEFTTPPENIEYSEEDAEIVGFFGVVGELSGAAYSSNFNEIKNVTLNNFTVESTQNENTLIGLAAGYCNASMSGVKVGTSEIITNGQGHTTYTDNLSDYGLVGYVDEEFTDSEDSENAYQQDISEYYHHGGDDSSSGEGAEWGGSFNSKEYTTWFYNKFAPNISTTSSGNTYSVANEFKLLYTTSTLAPPTAYFNYGSGNTASNYYSFNKDYSGVYRNGSVTRTFTWEIDNNAAYADYCKGVKVTFSSAVTISGASYTVVYLHNHGGSTEPQQIFQYKTSSGYGKSKNQNNLIGSDTNYFLLNTEPVYRFRNTAYLPLRFSDETKTATHADNTGYIIGTNLGTQSNASPKVAAYEMRFINNSISDTSVTYADISKGKGEFDYTDANLEVLTYNGSNWVCIKDSHNQNHTKSNSSLSSYTKSDATTPEALGFLKYDDSRNSLQTIFEENPRIHAIHFDSTFNGTTPKNVIGDYDATDADNTTKGLAVNSGIKINGATYNSTYYLPKGSIDFSLKKTGLINFFAGTYATTTNATFNFFSVYEVDRAKTAPYTYTVHEIDKVYRNKYWDSTKESDAETNPKYFYEYNTNPKTYSNIVVNGVTRVATTDDRDTDVGNDGVEFNVSILRSAAPVSNALYYFEIPVNNGEFAMGFVSSATATTQQGAYLIYLDIGANADTILSDEITAYAITTYTHSTNVFPVGVDFNTSDITSSVPGGETFGIIISPEMVGDVDFVVSGTTITYSADYETTYAYLKKSATTGGSNAPPKEEFNINTSIGTRIITCHIAEVADSSITWDIVMSLDLESGEYEYESIMQGSTSKNPEQLPSSFTSILPALKTQVANTAVSLTRISGSNTFNATPTYSGDDYKAIAISVALNGIEISAHGKANGYTITINDTVMNTDPKIYPVS